MARKQKVELEGDDRNTITSEVSVVTLARSLSMDNEFVDFKLWIVGRSPLIVHSWSHKSRTEMLQKQAKAVKGGKEARDPQRDFTESLYPMGDKPESGFGFPVTGIKKSILSVAHKDRGIAKVTARSGLWLDSEIVRTRPALQGAVCDMPLVRIWGSTPVMREDMGRIGVGLNKTANLIYRAEFPVWAICLTGRYNKSQFDEMWLSRLIIDAGLSTGIGEWRNEKDGVFGSYELATPEQSEAWDAYAAGTGPLPVPEAYKMAAE